MPFDGRSLGGAYAKIDLVIDLLSDEDRWCKKQLRTRDGRRCIMGAMIDLDAKRELTRPVLRAIEELTGHGYVKIETFNDDPATTHALAMAVLYRARELIVSGAVDAGGESGGAHRSLAGWNRLRQACREWAKAF